MNTKLIIILLAALINPSAFFAQEKNVMLYGKIENSQGDSVFLESPYGKDCTLTNQEGQFKFDLNFKNLEFLNFTIGDDQVTLFLSKGDTLEMNLNKNDFYNSISYHGDSEQINSQLLLVSKGKPAPGFSLKDTNGNVVKLSDFKGKYVYIDVWNSACFPCFKEFPLLEPLIEKYKDIVFLGVNLDQDEGTWKKTLEAKALKGIQLFANGWNSDFGKDYFIKFNPRFILIDKDQKIYYLSAPRPSGNIDGILGKLK